MYLFGCLWAKTFTKYVKLLGLLVTGDIEEETKERFDVSRHFSLSELSIFEWDICHLYTTL